MTDEEKADSLVEDALVAVETYDAELASRIKQLESASNAAELSWVRYEGGLTSSIRPWGVVGPQSRTASPSMMVLFRTSRKTNE